MTNAGCTRGRDQLRRLQPAQRVPFSDWQFGQGGGSVVVGRLVVSLVCGSDSRIHADPFVGSWHILDGSTVGPTQYQEQTSLVQQPHRRADAGT